jgi:fatty acid CoA ligase FadD9
MRTIFEDDDLRVVLPERPIDGGYASGYSTSKWASEILLRDAHDKLAIPIGVFRPSGIMADSRYRGQVNVPDFFTRLLAGIIYTRVAPRSFYAADASDRVRHYDGLPADVVARSIVMPSVFREPDALHRWHTYHVVNPHHDDGIGLDEIVHWVKTAGYYVERIADYDAWYRTFHDRLVALSETQRQHSPLPILQAWARPRGNETPLFDATRLLERLRTVSPTLADLPHVSEALIHKYLDDMTARGVLEPRMRATGT